MDSQPQNNVSPSVPVPIRKPPPAPHILTRGPVRIPPTLQAKMVAIANRSNQANGHSHPNGSPVGSSSTHPVSGIEHSSLLQNFQSSRPNHVAPRPPMTPPAKRKRPPFQLADILGPDADGISSGGASGAGLGSGRPDGPQQDAPGKRPPPHITASPFANFDKIVDPSGALNFNGKAVLHAQGVDFSNGSSFAINMSQLQLLEELGRGNYGTVKKVLHKPTNVLMAMKEIRLELDATKLNAILMELDILHRAVAHEIVEFYGAFFIESCVYYCMEFMDAGSVDKLQEGGIPEGVLARVAHSMVRGLKFLKDEMQIIHRDVKPTNVLVNKRGDVKLCDFGVSGQLEKSLAKTNIGCQSYMAPERIKGESQNNPGKYSVSSDVWSLGLSIVEMSMGHYPYPPETYENVFAQLTAIVHGPAPQLPDRYSDIAIDFVDGCMQKDPNRRATYSELLDHTFLVQDRTSKVDMAGWVEQALARNKQPASGSGDTKP